MADERKQESEHETKWNFGQVWCRDIKPKFKNLKQEALNNSFSKLSKDKWNSILSKSRHIIDCKVGSPQSIRYSKLLRENNVTLKHVIAVKLYTDDDKLQREFRKCFISKHQSDIDHKQRLSEFYHWYKLLKIAFAAFSKVQYKNGHEILYHGVKCKSIINNQDGIYHGPLSTTTDIGVAREFAGNQGMILIIKPNKSDYNPINTEFLSDYPHEKEILLFNHNIHIQDYIYSIDYDNHYSYHKTKSTDFITTTTKSTDQKEKIINFISSKTNNTTDHDEKEDVVYIKSNDAEEKEKILKLSLSEKEEINLAALSIIYQCACSIVCNLTKYQRNQYISSQFDSVNQILKQFKSISIPTPLYNAFLSSQSIDYTQCTRILSEYIRVAA